MPTCAASRPAPGARSHTALACSAVALASMLLAGCAATAPVSTPAARPSGATPTVTVPATEAPSSTASASPSASESAPATDAVPHEWQHVETGDGLVSWSMPADWRVAPGADDGPEDFTGLIESAAGVPMLQYAAVRAGQYANDTTVCDRPETVVFESTPMPDRGAGHLVALAYEVDDAVRLASGASVNDPATACDPGILAVYPSDALAPFSYIRLDIVGDDGLTPPAFASVDAARAYLETEEYRTIRQVIMTLEIG